MVDYGLLQHLGNGVYIITDIGEQYLDGECDAADLDEDEESLPWTECIHSMAAPSAPTLLRGILPGAARVTFD